MDRPSRGIESVAHLLIVVAHRLRRVLHMAEVVLEVVHAPRRCVQASTDGLRHIGGRGLGALRITVIGCVQLLVAHRAGKVFARQLSSVGVDAELESETVDVVAEGTHAAWELLAVRDDVPIGCAVPLPAVINIDVAVAGVAQSRADHCARDLTDQTLVDVAPELVPAVPSHGRYVTHAIIERPQAGQPPREQQMDSGATRAPRAPPHAALAPAVCRPGEGGTSSGRHAQT